MVVLVKDPPVVPFGGTTIVDSPAGHNPVPGFVIAGVPPEPVPLNLIIVIVVRSYINI